MRTTLLLAGLVLCSGFAASAQTIGLEEVRALALANSRSLAKYNLAVMSTLRDERARVFSTLPSLSLGANAGVNLWNAQNVPPAASPYDTFSSGANVSVSQKIFEGGRTLIQKAINEIASESARKDALAEYFNVLDSADNAYYAVLEAAAVLEAEESSLETARTSLAIAEVRQSTGMINRGDYLKAMAEKETRENYRNQARRGLTLNMVKLKALTGLSDLPALRHIDLSGYEELIARFGKISDSEADALYAELWKAVAAANPSLAKARLAGRQAENNLSMAQRAYFPSLSASFSTGLTYSTANRMERSGGRLSLNLSVPLDHWATANNIEKSRIARDSAALDYASAEVNLQTELQSTLLNVFSYAGSVLHSRLSLEYSQRNFEFVMERYRLSLSSVTDLNEASTLLINSRNSLITASYGFLQSLSKLRSLGTFMDEERLITLLKGEQ